MTEKKKKRYPADRQKLHALLDRREQELLELQEEVEDLHARVRRLADRVRELETRTPVGAIVRVTPTRRLP